MPVKAPPFKPFFEIIFLESYASLGTSEKKSIDKAIKILADNPRHPSLNIHKAKYKRGRWFQNDLPTEYIKGIGFLYAKISQI